MHWRGLLARGGALIVACCVGMGASSLAPKTQPAKVCGAADGALTVMTYNIRTGLGTRNPGKNPLHQIFAPHDIGPVIAAIAAADPDVVALQEVLGRRQVREIAAALGMQSVYAAHPSPIPWWGTAVLSKCTLTHGRRVVTSQGRGNGKSMALAQISVAGTPVIVTSLHRDRDDNSGAQIDAFLAPFSAQTTAGLLMGDFNFVPSDARHAKIAARFEDSAQVAQRGGDHAEARGTFPVHVGRKPPRRIDYVFVSKSNFSVLEVGLVEGQHSAASDHLAYVAHLRLKPNAK